MKKEGSIKKLIVFCDGTWNEPDKNPTNVAKLFEATDYYDHQDNPQIAHYIQGVGTHWYDKIMGGAFGFGISDNIRDGYKFLCSNYEPGDEIYLFGFSRGAYTARSLGGLIYNMGILKRCHFDKVDEAYNGYKNKSIDWHPNPDKGSKAKSFREEYTYGNEKIHFIGVWDTVGALGSPYGLILGYLSDKLFGCRFHDVKLNSSIQSASHAISKDEHRWPFRPTRWVLQNTHNPANFVEQWFNGVHSDVGGGYQETGLSDQTLQWMVNQISQKLAISLTPATPPSDPQRLKIWDNQHDSQTWYYRWATLLAVKWPAFLVVDIPGKVFKNWPDYFYGKLNQWKILAEPDIKVKIGNIQCHGKNKGNYQRN